MSRVHRPHHAVTSMLGRTRDRSVASGSTIGPGSAILMPPSAPKKLEAHESGAASTIPGQLHRPWLWALLGLVGPHSRPKHGQPADGVYGGPPYVDSRDSRTDSRIASPSIAQARSLLPPTMVYVRSQSVQTHQVRSSGHQ